MINLLLALLLAPITQADDSCREESLVHFYSQNEEVQSKLIGADDPCDKFGGNLVYSPQNKIYLYVNFNIAGQINLDELDQALKQGNHPERQKIQLAVVDKGWIKRVYNDDREAVLNWSGDTLFISQPVLEEGRFLDLMREFYSIN